MEGAAAFWKRNDGVRSRQEENDDGTVVHEGYVVEAKKTTKDINGIVGSLLLLEEQERHDHEARNRASRGEKSDFELNYRKRTRTMSHYYSSVQDYIAEADDNEKFDRRKPSCTAVVSVAAFGYESTGLRDGSGCTSSGSGHQRRLWVRYRSRAWWEECNRPDYPDEEFKQAFRMSKTTFETLCEELKSAVAKEDTTLRNAIPVRQRVAVCIWRLATGEPLRLVSKRFGLGISTCHKLVLEVCSAIKNVLMPKYLHWPADDYSLNKIKDEFKSISGIPNIIGSMYTGHIPIIAPKISVAAYFNKKHTERNQKHSYSITIQAVVNPNGVFTDVCIGWPGSLPDDQILEKSLLYQRAVNGGLVKGTWIVGGSGHQLLDWVLVPYTQQNLTWTQHAFNEKVGEVHRVAMEAFGRLKGRWACLQRRTEVKLQDLPTVLGACCVLHNICEMKAEEFERGLAVEMADDAVAPENALRSVRAMKARDAIAHNLLHHGLAGTSFL